MFVNVFNKLLGLSISHNYIHLTSYHTFENWQRTHLFQNQTKTYKSISLFTTLAKTLDILIIIDLQLNMQCNLVASYFL